MLTGYVVVGGVGNSFKSFPFQSLSHCLGRTTPQILPAPLPISSALYEEVTTPKIAPRSGWKCPGLFI